MASNGALIQILSKKLLSTLVTDDLGPEEDEHGDYPRCVA